MDCETVPDLLESESSRLWCQSWLRPVSGKFLHEGQGPVRAWGVSAWVPGQAEDDGGGARDTRVLPVIPA